MSAVAKLIEGEINKLSPRAAMGLPESYTPPKLSAPSKIIDDLSECSKEELVAKIEDPKTNMEVRFASGTLLSVRGDSRLNYLDPKMVTVPGGEATIGLPENRVDALFGKYETYGVLRSWIEKECPRFTTEISEFRIGRYPVTNIEYAAFLDDRPEAADIPTSWADGIAPVGQENRPVYTVLPEAADAYASWLAEKTGRAFRLPTEYEWEYAAAGPDGLDYPWGDIFSEDACNTCELGVLSTTPVGMFPKGRSWCGADDLAGNVEEYVQSTYHAYPGGEIVHDDLYTLLGAYRIARGGAYNRFQDLARCQRRHGPYPNSLYAMGFRLAEDV